MKPRYWLTLAVVASAVFLGWRIDQWRNQPPEVSFARVARETIVSPVLTNGKVEPVEWATARAERPGAVSAILIQKGQRVEKGAPLVELDASEARAEKVSAESKIAEIRAELDTLERGGRAADLAEIASGLDRAHLDLTSAQNDYDSLKRLEAKQAATRVEVQAAKQRVDQQQLQIKSLEAKKAALVGTSDRASAQARLEDAQANLRLADDRIRQSTIYAPLAGIVYQFDLKPGAYLNAGDPVAQIGKMDKVNVTVYVDEQDLGRVSAGMPVTITWDAMAGRSWKGAVDKTPTQIIALGSRQVGEVVCLIENPNRDLLPGTNVTASIRSESVDNALTIPKEAVRRELGQAGVYVLQGDDRLAWRKVTLGVNNITRTQVQGLNEGDAVVISSEKPLRDGMTVKALFP